MAFPLSRLYDYTQTYHTRKDTYGRVISPTKLPLPDNTQQSHQTCAHASGGIRTRNPSKRAAADRAATGIGRTATQLSGGGTIPFPSSCVLERWSKPDKAKHDSKYNHTAKQEWTVAR